VRMEGEDSFSSEVRRQRITPKPILIILGEWKDEGMWLWWYAGERAIGLAQCEFELTTEGVGFKGDDMKELVQVSVVV
jgi:hypothetical protein